MKKIEKIIDCSCWSGNWPFYYLRYGRLQLLRERLEKYNIVKAYVSPIETILEPEPLRANLAFFEEIDKIDQKGYFLPVPVIDLSMDTWQEIIDISLKRNDVKIVKLLPNYHMYNLSEETLEELVDRTMRNNLIISIQMRVEDPRRHHPLMKVADVDIIKTIKVLSGFPQQKFIISNGYLNEVQQALYYLDNAYADVSSAEIQDVLSLLAGKYDKNRLLFSTHSAFYYPEASVFKLAYSGLDEESMDKVAYRNASELGL